ncbi:MAG: hypothetical protein JNK78_13935 [Planctomycetes bacterium]|nr:hypothetical protein [Planctomycetota bacterium]
MRPWLSLLVILPALPLSGCCSLARFWCGPDKTPWVQQRFDTPLATARTLLEAIRRDDPEVVYLCLSDGYRRRLGIDSMTAVLAWQRIREQNPGLHVAGYANVPAPRRTGDDRATVAVEVEGLTIELDFERQAYWEVRYVSGDGVQLEQGGTTNFAARALVAADPAHPGADDATTRVVVGPLVLVHDPEAPIAVDALDHVALTRRWKVSDLRVR